MWKTPRHTSPKKKKKRRVTDSTWRLFQVVFFYLRRARNTQNRSNKTKHGNRSYRGDHLARILEINCERAVRPLPLRWFSSFCCCSLCHFIIHAHAYGIPHPNHYSLFRYSNPKTEANGRAFTCTNKSHSIREEKKKKCAQNNWS